MSLSRYAKHSYRSNNSGRKLLYQKLPRVASDTRPSAQRPSSNLPPKVEPFHFPSNSALDRGSEKEDGTSDSSPPGLHELAFPSTRTTATNDVSFHHTLPPKPSHTFAPTKLSMSTQRFPAPADNITPAHIVTSTVLSPIISSNALGLSPLPTPPPSATISTSPSILLSREEHELICDLETISENPDDVIRVLCRSAASSSERDKWMIVAGHYRRKGNTEAAIMVVEAMVQGRVVNWNLVKSAHPAV